MGIGEGDLSEIDKFSSLREHSPSPQARFDVFGNVLWDIGQRVIPEKVWKAGFLVLALGLGAGYGFDEYKIERAKQEVIEKGRKELVAQNDLFLQERTYEIIGLEYLAQGNLVAAKEQRDIGENLRPKIPNNLSELNSGINAIERKREYQSYLVELRNEFSDSRYTVQVGDNLFSLTKKYFEAIHGRLPEGNISDLSERSRNEDTIKFRKYLQEIRLSSGIESLEKELLTPGEVVRVPRLHAEHR